MFAYLDASLSVETVLWLFVVVFAMHDLEEIITVEGWFARHAERLKVRFPASVYAYIQRHASVRASEMAVAVYVVLLCVVGSVFAASQSMAGAGMIAFVAMLNVFFIHVFSHVGMAIATRSFTPGVTTAVAFVLPYTLYAYHRLLKDSVIDWPTIWYSLPFGLLLLPIVLFAHKLGSIVIRSLSRGA